MYGRFRRDKLMPNRKYTIPQIKDTLEKWLNAPRRDNRELKAYVYPSDKQLSGVVKFMHNDDMLGGNIIKVLYGYMRNNKQCYAIQYRNVLTGKRVKRVEYEEQQKELKEAGYGEDE